MGRANPPRIEEIEKVQILKTITNGKVKEKIIAELTPDELRDYGLDLKPDSKYGVLFFLKKKRGDMQCLLKNAFVTRSTGGRMWFEIKPKTGFVLTRMIEIVNPEEDVGEVKH